MPKFICYASIQFLILITVMTFGTIFRVDIMTLVSHNMVINSIILSIFIATTILVVSDTLNTIRKNRLCQEHKNAPTVFGKRYARITVDSGIIRDELMESWKAVIRRKGNTLDFISGTLIGIGLLGTFIGLMNTMGSVFSVLTAGVSGKELVAELGTSLSGMATAFSASMLGLVTSLTVGFQGNILDKFNEEFIAHADDWIVSLKETGMSQEEDLKSESTNKTSFIYLRKLSDGMENIRGAIEENNMLSQLLLDEYRRQHLVMAELTMRVSHVDEGLVKVHQGIIVLHEKLSGVYESGRMAHRELITLNEYVSGLHETGAMTQQGITALNVKLSSLYETDVMAEQGIAAVLDKLSGLSETGALAQQGIQELNSSLASGNGRLERIRVALDSVIKNHITESSERKSRFHVLKGHMQRLNEDVSGNSVLLEKIYRHQGVIHESGAACLQEAAATRSLLESSMGPAAVRETDEPLS